MIAGRVLDRLRDEFDRALRDGAPNDYVLDAFESLCEVVPIPQGLILVVGISGTSPEVGKRLLVTAMMEFEPVADFTEAVHSLYHGFRQLREQAFDRLSMEATS